MSTNYTNIPPEMSDSGGGVSTINTLSGDVVLVAGSGISITPAGNNLTIATTGGAAITALTGDGTATGPGSVPFTLATVNAGVGSFGTASNVSTITVNAKGLITAASNTPIQIAESQVTNLVSDLAGKQATGNYIIALTGDVSATGPGSVAATVNSVGGASAASIASTVTNAIRQGGNSFGAPVVIGSNDNNVLDLRTNGTLALEISTAGALTLKRATGANLLWDTDGGGNIGASGTTRPAIGYFRDEIHVGTNAAFFDTGFSSFGSLPNEYVMIGGGPAPYTRNYLGFWDQTIGEFYGFHKAPGSSTLSYGNYGGNTNPQLLNLANPTSTTLNLLWGTDATGSIGAAGANRPKTGFFSGDIHAGTNSPVFDDGFSSFGNLTNTYVMMGGAAVYGRAYLGFTNQSGGDFWGWQMVPGSTNVNYGKYSGNTNPTLLTLANPSTTTLNLLWGTDNTGDIGASGATRPKSIWLAGNAILESAGSGLLIKEGSNATMGVSTLVAGTVTVSTTKVTANSRIFLTAQNSSGVPGFVGVSARNAGTDFTITSASVADTSNIAWIIIEPA